MASRPKRRRQTFTESMELEDGGLTAKHQLMLQYLMHARMAKKMDVSKIHGKLFNDSESLSETLSTITNKIGPLKMDIKRVQCDVTGETYYVPIHTTGDPFFPKCCMFSNPQLMFLKTILTGIVLSDHGQIGRIQALNSCKTLSKSEGEVAITKFIKEKILIELQGGSNLCLSPLAVVEFEPFFNSCFTDNLFSCDLCKQLVFVGRACDGCNNKFHLHCVSKWVAGNHSDCPSCGKSWSIDMEADTD